MAYVQLQGENYDEWSRSHNTNFQVPRVEERDKDRELVPSKRRTVIRHTFRLPVEIIFNILLLIPAKDLHEVVRYVCKQWFDIVSDPEFVRLHHRQMSSSGFLIQNPNKNSKMSYIEADTTEWKVTEIQIPSPAKIIGSFNGLVLLHDLTETFHVMNPLTKVNITLPPLTGFCYNPRAGFGLTSSGLYKAIHVSVNPSSKHVQMRVFTLGVDTTWRFIDLQGISIDVLRKYDLMPNLRFIGGFIYWYSSIHFNGVALDVDTEKIYQFSPPDDLVRNNGYSSPIRFLSTGTCLGLIKQTGYVWRFWKLTGVETGKWTEVAGINIRPILSKGDKILYPSNFRAVMPIRLINGVFWFYHRVDDGCVVVLYDLVSESVSIFPTNNTIIHPHVHTLLSPKNCKPGVLNSSKDDYNNY